MESWYTYNELNFLDWLGTGIFRDKKTYQVPAARLAMLKGYLKGMSLRTDWGKLDPEAIGAHVRKLIQSIEQSNPQLKGEE